MLSPKPATTVVVLFSLIFFSSAVNAQSYRILVSNDDGIESPLLAALKQALDTLPDVEVVVAAPHENQSGASQSSGGFETRVDRDMRDGELFGYAVHGRPADAVRFGVLMLGAGQPFDLIVSGINQGANVGDVSHASGTVGAAMEGLFQGIPSIAISQETSDVDTQASAAFAARLVQTVRERGLPDGVMLSANIPGGELKGLKIMPMGDSYLETEGYELIDSDANGITYERIRVRARSENPDTDTYAYQDGYITITPLKFDWTATEFISELQTWGIE